MAFYNYEHFAMREESVVCFHRKAPPPVEHHTIIEDCHGVVYTSPNMAGPRDECGNRPKKTVTLTAASNIRPSLPPPHQGQYYPQANTYYQVPSDQIKRPVSNAVEGPFQMKKPVITSTEAAKLYGGYLVTEYGPSQMKKPVITSTEAAKLYGGYLVTEPRKPSRPY